MTTASTHIDELPIPTPSTAPVAGFAELYERHYEAVFRAALRVTGSPADAEDVLEHRLPARHGAGWTRRGRRAAGRLFPASRRQRGGRRAAPP